MARKSVSHGPDRVDPLAESTSARSTALDPTTSRRADVDDLDRRALDHAVESNENYASRSSHVSTLRWGYALVFGSASVLAVGLWSILIGPLCEPTGVPVRRLDVLLLRLLLDELILSPRSCSTSSCKTITSSTSSSSSYPSPSAS